MILIDTSSGVEFLCPGGRPEVKERVSLYLELDEAAVTGPVRFELLTGADQKSEPDVRALLELAADVPFEQHYWELAASTGLTIPRDDSFIATVAAERGLLLFHHDRTTSRPKAG